MSVIKEDFISAAIVTYNDSKKAVNTCKSIIENTKRRDLKLYVFDNASSDDTAKLLSETEGVALRKGEKNIGFGAAHNKILSEDRGKYHFVINPDITVSGDLLSSMADYMDANSDVVMMMPKILNSDGTVQYLPKEIPTFKRLFMGRLIKGVRDEFVWKNKQIPAVCEIDFCTGCFFCIRTEAFEKLGGFDERYFMYLEDADLTLRAKKLGKVVMNSNFTVVHEWERSSAKSLKYLIIHTLSAFKFLLRKGKILK